MGSLSRRAYATLAIVFAVVIFVALNIAADAWLTTARLDLTQNGLYTLNAGTIDTLNKIDEPLTLKFFYSKQVAAQYAAVQGYAKRVRDLLGEYAARSHGKIVIKDVDPEPFTQAEDEASSAGLSGAPTDTGDTVYFGLVGTNEIDGKEVIPYFTPEREKFLEYDLTSLIFRLSHPKKPVIGIVSSLPLDTGAGGMAAMMQGNAQPYVIYSELAQTFTTQMLGPAFDKIPANVDVLMIVHPPALSDAQQLAIDQFVLKGGRALVFVDPVSELAQASAGGGMQQGAGPIESDLPKLFRAWGVGYTPKKVVGDKALAQRVQSSDPANPIALYPVWLHLTADNFSPKDVVSSSLQVLNLASAGALHPLKGATTTFTPLVTSSNQAGLLDSEQVRMNGQPQSLMNAIMPTGEKFVIAARISGPAHTAFNGPMPGGPVAVKSGNINVIVMADADIFDDRFWVHTEDVMGKKVAAPFADNAAFVLDAVENLTGSADLISLRTRATNDRPFTVVQDMQKQAGQEYVAQAQMLKARLTEAQQHLHELEQGSGGAAGQTGITPAQQTEIDKFKHELIETRTALRDVQHNLRKQVDSLGAFLAFVNIALVPLIVAIFAIVLASLRRRRRARGRAL
ncbi:MAG TPA: Gldg family protein [Rhizomicrobium sp.]|jgi:ABC-type uncharacterized transport system involved in gliding motility auxiliary subunit